MVEQHEKETKLPILLERYHKSRTNRVLVFALYKKEAARVEETLRRRGYNAIGIHGDMTQAARTHALQQFKEGKAPLLVATDVAARGLDIPDVEVVINYTFPLTIEDYIHRFVGVNDEGEMGVMAFDRTLDDWIGFDINNRTKFDLTISSGLALLAAQKYEVKKFKKEKATPKQFFRRYGTGPDGKPFTIR